jgi:hypothetical protein
VLGLVKIDIYTSGSRNQPPVEMHFPLAVFFFLPPVVVFPPFLNIQNKN